MSAFGSKRKARVVQTFEDAEVQEQLSSVGPGRPGTEVSTSDQGALKFKRKSLKQSSLRRSINLNDDVSEDPGSAKASDEDDSGAAAVVVRPSIGRSGSGKQKARVSSQLSFGPSHTAGADEEDGAVTRPPRRNLSQRALGSNALGKQSPASRLRNRSPDSDDDDRPKYSAEYLAELQSATPNAPQDLSSLQIASDADDMDLDPSELAGAVIVEHHDLARTAGPPGDTAPTILTETEIQARKARRARLALEQDAMQLSDDDDGDGHDPSSTGAHYISLQSRASSTKKKKGDRLIAEDEDLGEGYDEFVEDGGLSLGRKAERAAAVRHRDEMAALIQAAEGGAAHGDGDDDDDGSDSSDAERRAAYEAAQTRAGMDGLARPDERGVVNGHGTEVDNDAIIPRMKPLPELGESLARLRALVQELQDDVAKRRGRIAELEKEKAEILTREAEVQEILNETGQKYQAAFGGAATGSAAPIDVVKLAQSPLRPLPGAPGSEQRGLESFGTTPLRKELEMEE